MHRPGNVVVAVAGAVTGATLAGGLLVALAGPAGADVVTPPGACVGTGTWQDAGLSETSAEHSPSDVIAIPRSDTVSWAGGIGSVDAPDGEEREVSGQIEVVLPVGTIGIDDWGGDSERYSNSGDYEYDVSSMLIGIEMTLQGVHHEDGAEVCSGSVGIVVDGSMTENPLAAGGLVGLLVSAFGGVQAARGKR